MSHPGVLRTAVAAGLGQAVIAGWALTASAASITGTVTAAGAPVVAVAVRAYDSTGLPAGISTGSTNSLGQYTINGLTAGTYFVRTTVVPAGYLNQIYDGIVCGSTCPSVTTGSPVSVTTGGTTALIDFALVEGGKIGRTSARGRPIT